MKHTDWNIRQIPLFRGLTPQEAARVEAIAILRAYKRKTNIFMEGSPKEAIYFIRSGLVKTYKTDEDGHEQIVSLLQPGDMFPHFGFFDSAPYPATAEALTDAQLLAIPVGDFEQLIMQTPAIAVKVIDEMGAKIRELQQKLQAMSGQDVNGRIVSYLLHLAEQLGEPRGTAIYIELPVTNQEIASAIGTSRETVNRLLNQLKKRKLLDARRSFMVITDLEGLKQLASL